MFSARPHEPMPATHSPDSAATSGAGVPDLVVESARLLQGRREVRIRHGNEWYRLRHTRNDKLILTK